MIYLTGVTNDRDEPALIAAGMGLMCQPGNSYHLRVARYPAWAADNGCFGDRWVEDEHLAWLDALPRERCLFAVAPDVYPDAGATLERFGEYGELLRSMGFPVALVAQDGAEELAIPWADLDVLFIGGERTWTGTRLDGPEWKLSPAAERMADEARRHGKWVHMGRVNSLRRLEHARAMGCNSVDGTFIKYRTRAKGSGTRQGVDASGAGELEAWSRWLTENPMLPLKVYEAPAHPAHRERSHS